MTETEQIEYKRSVSELKEGIISISAILNKHGKGVLYFGLDYEGNSTQQKFSEKTLRDISQKISAYVEPKIFPEVEKENDYIIKICHKFPTSQ